MRNIRLREKRLKTITTTLFFRQIFVYMYDVYMDFDVYWLPRQNDVENKRKFSQIDDWIDMLFCSTTNIHFRVRDDTAREIFEIAVHRLPVKLSGIPKWEYVCALCVFFYRHIRWHQQPDGQIQPVHFMHSKLISDYIITNLFLN